MIPDFAAAIDIGIDPDLISGAFSLTWHGLFTAVGIALGVWLSLRLARGARISGDDAWNIALVAVPSGVVGARLLWVLEHTDQIHDVGDIIALTDGGISVYGGMIGGAIGGFTYVALLRPRFPKWVGLDVAAPGMILGQALGRIGDLINGEHFAKATDLPWAFRYTDPATDGPWGVIADGEVPAASTWFRGQSGVLGEGPVPVHPVAGLYEPLLDLAILGGLLLMRRLHVLPGWGFVFYVLAYGAVRGSLALLRTDEQNVFGNDLSVPQLLAIATGAIALLMAWHLYRKPQQPASAIAEDRAVVPPASRRRRAHSGIGGRVRIRSRRPRR